MISMNDGQVTLHRGDCREILRTIDDNSIDSVVCDPPYALTSITKRFGKEGAAAAKHGTDGAFSRSSAGFMGKQWDNGEAAFAETFWAEVLRVLKPGGFVLAFGGTRTYHRLASAIDDAGFEVRDMIGWLYGSGFPKSHNQHDDWEGWGTALKPAQEPICMARKPIDGTNKQNLEKWGVGCLNIDKCRVGDEEVSTHSRGASGAFPKRPGETSAEESGRRTDQREGLDHSPRQGRWPANIIHDGSDEVAGAFPDAKGQQGDLKGHSKGRKSKGIFGDMPAARDAIARVETDKSAARFFYCAKASKADRDAGLEHLPDSTGGFANETSGQHITRREEDYVPKPRKNIHPTVKPTSLMQYLCRLVTPPGGVVLDPFMGSGSTGKAAVLEGFKFIGIEREDEYMPIAQARIAWAIGNKHLEPVGGALPKVKSKKPNVVDTIDLEEHLNALPANDNSNVSAA